MKNNREKHVKIGGSSELPNCSHIGTGAVSESILDSRTVTKNWPERVTPDFYVSVPVEVKDEAVCGVIQKQKHAFLRGIIEKWETEESKNKFRKKKAKWE